MTMYSKLHHIQFFMHARKRPIPSVPLKATALDSLRSDPIRRHGIANFTRVVSELNLFKSSGAILFQRHLPHLGLAAIASKLELHHGSSSRFDKLNNFVDLEDEAIFEELGQAGLVDKVSMASDDENARHFPTDGVAAVLDSVVRDFDAVALNVEASGPRQAEELLSGLGSEEDNLGSSSLMGDIVGIIDIAAPDTADVADGRKKLMGSHSRGQVCQPKSAVLFRSEMLSAGIGLGMHTMVSS